MVGTVTEIGVGVPSFEAWLENEERCMEVFQVSVLSYPLRPG